jgi:type VI secretion system (T6SS) baseplate-like injector VgrG
MGCPPIRRVACDEPVGDAGGAWTMNPEDILACLVEQAERRFYGKYRGIVVDNADPSRRGRLRLTVPSLLGPDVVTGWATPCVPYGGAADQGFLFIPERNAKVWVEFEEGDLEFPIWVGSFWCKPDSGSQLPRPQADDGTEQDEAQDPPTRKIIKTLKGHTIQFEDADDAETILLREGSQGHLVTMNRNGITIVDKSENTILLSADGIQITDTTGNAITMTDSAFTLTAKVAFTIDAAGQPVTIVGDSIDLKKG